MPELNYVAMRPRRFYEEKHAYALPLEANPAGTYEIRGIFTNVDKYLIDSSAGLELSVALWVDEQNDIHAVLTRHGQLDEAFHYATLVGYDRDRDSFTIPEWIIRLTGAHLAEPLGKKNMMIPEEARVINFAVGIFYDGRRDDVPHIRSRTVLLRRIY